MSVVVDGLPYPIIVSESAPRDVADIASRVCRRAVVLSDRNVAPRGAAVAGVLRESGCDVLADVSLQAGERRKRWQTVSDVHASFAAAGVDRESLVVAVGGGTLTDIAGFASATFLRGVRWLAVPTTVLGMVDAGIGGKTGVDRPEGKNLVGSFWPPVGVIADLAALLTLPPSQKKTGMAEVIKAAVVGDPALLDAAQRFDVDRADPQAWQHLISHAAAVKAQVVSRDPLDRNVRAALNLGHTFAHGIEHATKYRIAHGPAVALGLRVAGVLARDRTGWPRDDHRRVLRALRRAGLRVHKPGLSGDAILDAMRSDKKRRNGILRFVLPVRLGEVRCGVEIPEADVSDAIAALATPPLRDRW